MAGSMELTYIYPWGPFHPVRCGSAMVARAHMNYFRSRGIRPSVIVPINGTTSGLAAFESEYSWVKELCYFPLHAYPEIERFFHTWAFESYLAGFAAMAEVPRFRAVLGKPADVVFCNYVFSSPLLDAVHRDAVRIVEAHDFLSRQFLGPQATPALCTHYLSLEFELYALFDAVLMINESEAMLANQRGVTNAVYVPQPVELAAAGTPAEEQGPPLYDLLFVGSDHPPNVEGAQWFYEHVFEPHLRERGLRWAIVGSVCRGLTIRDASVHLLGFVEDLAGIYRRAKVVVIPLFRGAGTSIKTLEALGYAKPIVTTACGRRGLKHCDEALLELDLQADPLHAAQCIEHLCASRPARETLGSNAYAYARRWFSPNAYGNHLDAVFQRLLPGRFAANTLHTVRAA